MEAVSQLNKLQKEELHNIERPIAYIAYQTAEINRDAKKRRKPFEPSSFYFYANEEEMDLPEPKYGAAAMELIRRELFPNWALFTYHQLKKRADDALPPDFLCLQCDDVIVLAPDIDAISVHGMMIAGRTASRQERTLVSPCGKTVKVQMPIITGRFEATEESELIIIG